MKNDLQKAVGLHKQLKEFYNTEIFAFDGWGIQIEEELFFDTFKEYTTAERQTDEFPYEYRAEVDGERIYCISITDHRKETK